MATESKITLRVDDKATPDIKKVNDSVNGLKGSLDGLSSVGPKLTGIGNALTIGVTGPIVAAATALTALTMKVAGTADEIDKMSQRSGISRQSLQELRYVADQTGVSFSTFERLAVQLGTRMSGLEDGNNDAAKAFQELGISTTDATGKLRNSGDVFEEAIEKLSGIGNEAERNRLTLALFGRAGADLKPMLNQGTEAIEDMRKAANRFGLVLSDETIDILVTLGDSLTDVKAAFSGLANGIIEEFGPILRDDLIPLITERLIPAIQQIATEVAKVVRWYTDLNQSQRNVINVTIGLVAAIGPVISIMGRLLTAVNLARNALVALRTAGLLAAGPAGWAVIAIGAVAALAISLSGKKKTELVGASDEAIKSLTTELRPAVEGVTSSMVVGETSLLSGLQAIAEDLTGDSKDALEQYAGQLEELGEDILITMQNIALLPEYAAAIIQEAKTKAAFEAEKAFSDSVVIEILLEAGIRNPYDFFDPILGLVGPATSTTLDQVTEFGESYAAVWRRLEPDLRSIFTSDNPALHQLRLDFEEAVEIRQLIEGQIQRGSRVDTPSPAPRPTPEPEPAPAPTPTPETPEPSGTTYPTRLRSEWVEARNEYQAFLREQIDGEARLNAENDARIASEIAAREALFDFTNEMSATELYNQKLIQEEQMETQRILAETTPEDRRHQENLEAYREYLKLQGFDAQARQEIIDLLTESSEAEARLNADRDRIIAGEIAAREELSAAMGEMSATELYEQRQIQEAQMETQRQLADTTPQERTHQENLRIYRERLAVTQEYSDFLSEEAARATQYDSIVRADTEAREALTAATEGLTAAELYQQEQRQREQMLAQARMAAIREQNQLAEEAIENALLRGKIERTLATQTVNLSSIFRDRVKETEVIIAALNTQVSVLEAALVSSIESATKTGDWEAYRRLRSELREVNEELRIQKVLLIAVKRNDSAKERAAKYNGVSTAIISLNQEIATMESLLRKANRDSIFLEPEDIEQLEIAIADARAELELLENDFKLDKLKKGLNDAQGHVRDATSLIGDMMKEFGASDEAVESLNLLGSAVDDAFGAAMSFASGDIIGGIIQTVKAIFGIFKWLRNLFKTQEQRDAEALAERWKGIIEGIRQQMEQGFGSALTNALRQLGTGQIERKDFEKVFKKGVYEAVLDGIIEALVQKAIIEGALSETFEAIGEAAKEGNWDEVNDLVVGVGNKTDQIMKDMEVAIGAVEGYYDNYLKQFADVPEPPDPKDYDPLYDRITESVSGFGTFVSQAVSIPLYDAAIHFTRGVDKFEMIVDRLINPGINVNSTANVQIHNQGVPVY